MTIEDAKRDLEPQIIQWDGVIGIGIINHQNSHLIEIAIDQQNTAVTEKLQSLIKDNRWMGYDVRIVPTKGFELL